ncbi:unnamed protein product [Strongylus vulgaris]|uniref:Uncharacterized protein n=1 Tax=Strongylus vulgaris TaxID=40348 RepID=A0A3P7ITS3_STRVU|nr:unnamed protein product [Strongylus vulgaris]
MLGEILACIACKRKRSLAHWIISTASDVIKTSVRLHRTPWISPPALYLQQDSLHQRRSPIALLEVARHQLPRNRLAGKKVQVDGREAAELWHTHHLWCEKDHGTLEALDLSYTPLLSILSVRMRSYRLAWLPFDFVLCIR